MVGQNQTFAEGASINRPPLFTGENYPFWKVRMQIFLESIDRGIWDAILNGPFVPVNIGCAGTKAIFAMDSRRK